ncbi:small GTP-binding protein, putative [Trichomonas vaginalis G3]|uniref:Small GTP-binding protein, putative n=1 Tax=Trichomonas vaginalis (strain ATCC PRA-98 / G3) TaxID=412133 RepID=A2FV67_TRIV3|nr:GTPase protein [Trichomonas vaginalis G3]EAX91203.1 small GTP-binding protein, putative [Trichomonas vaginalis G3]KAI5517083.1 GTPase protein [Trichomonas vaginalis G3]|eukprot:XP_001304133.1 small GTP-binding protein [Trichomonas vaginalis G3]
MTSNETQPRIIFIGDSGVGKTSIIHYAKNGFFESRTMTTIGAGITQMETKVGNETVKYQLWDTAGQEMYRNIVPIYFKGATAAIIVFSVTDAETFRHLDGWIKQLQDHASEKVGIVLVGNKIDSPDHKVEIEEGNAYGKTYGYPVIYTSAVTGENIDVLIDHIASSLAAKSTFEGTSVNIQTPAETKKKCC